LPGAVKAIDWVSPQHRVQQEVMSPPESFSFLFLFLFPLSPRPFLTKEKEERERFPAELTSLPVAPLNTRPVENQWPHPSMR
jgi:hypothetical protein